MQILSTLTMLCVQIPVIGTAIHARQLNYKHALCTESSRHIDDHSKGTLWWMHKARIKQHDRQQRLRSTAAASQHPSPQLHHNIPNSTINSSICSSVSLQPASSKAPQGWFARDTRETPAIATRQPSLNTHDLGSGQCTTEWWRFSRFLNHQQK